MFEQIVFVKSPFSDSNSKRAGFKYQVVKGKIVPHFITDI